MKIGIEPADTPAAGACDARHKLAVEGLSVHYREKPVFRDVHLAVCRGCVTSVIGPSGCGKTTFLLALNRLVEEVPGARVEGRVLLDGVDIRRPGVKLQNVRRRVGLIFQKPNPFPLGVFQNVALPLREHGLSDRHQIEERVERSLRAVGLWEEVKDRLHRSALALSGGQQQRLCLARATALHPEVLLMDEPCSALDPLSSARVEELIGELATRYTVLVVTHNLAQARRVSAFTAFLHAGDGGGGRLVEYGPTAEVFENARHPLTRDYVTGRTG